MREVKFRAWDINHKKWYSRVHVGTNCGHAVYDEEREMWLEFDEFCGVVVQWTGLTDRNGKEIYEGDVVTLPFEPNNDLMQAVIEWNFDGWKFRWLKKRVINIRGKEIEPVFHNIKFFEIIGNIYENPELLKEENQ